MELSDFLRLFRRSWALIVVMTLSGTLAAGALSLATTKVYTAKADLYVTVQAAAESTAGEAVQGSSAAQAKVRSYVKVATSAVVLQPVIDELSLRDSVPSLANRVSVTTQTNTVLMGIAVTDPDPALAAAIANAITKSFSSVVVDDLEKTEANTPSLIRITTLQKATPPRLPSSPNVPVNLAVGLLTGLLLGVAAAVVRNTLDTRLHGNGDIELVTETPVLGGIGFDSEAAVRPLVVHLDPRSPRAESFRSLRTNLQFIDPGASGRSYVITSAMPSEGKSTTTANLAIAIAESGSSVALVDADLRRPRVAEIMGLEGAVGLSNLLIGQVELEDVMQTWGRGGLAVLPAGRIPPNPSELLGSLSMQAVIDDLTSRFDFVLMDAPPLLPVTDAAILSKLTNGAIVAVAARSSRRTQLKSALDVLDRIGSRTLGIVVTKLPVKGAGAYGYGRYEAYYGRSPDTETSREQQPARRSRIAESVR